jgi:hypothetical protein
MSEATGRSKEERSAMSTNRSGGFVVAVALAVVAAAPWSRIARAEETDARAAAKAKVEEGAGLLKGHQDAGALAAFEDAYQIFPSPRIFFNIGLANVGLARNPQALRAFQRFLIEAPDASVESVSRAKAQVQALLPKVAIVDVISPRPGLEIVVDGESMGRSPLTAPLYLDPGQHRLLAKANETAPPSVKTFEVAGGTRIRVAVPVSPPPMAAPSPAAVATRASAPPSAPDVENHGTSEVEPRPIYARPWFWAAAAGVVAAVTVSLVLTVGSSTKDPTPSLMPMTLPGAP